MRNRKQTTAIALTGAVALASGAYALGTQSGDGSAEAAGNSARPSAPSMPVHLRGGPFGLDNLADRLGVDESDLRDALEDARRDLPGPGHIRDDFAEQLAKELGVDTQKVEDALERIRDRAKQEFERRRDELAQRLADRLNLDVDEVEEALGDFPFFEHAAPAPPRTP
jgi:Clp amino terminal domain, pathogenicity island component